MPVSTRNQTAPAGSLLLSGKLSAVPGVRHGFTTATGGLSLASTPDLTADQLVENYRIALQALGATDPGDVAILSQVHGARVIEVQAPSGPMRTLGEADGAWTTRTGVVLAVRTADCVPVLLAAPGGVAVAHAGWRGTVAGVVPATVAALCSGAACAPGDVVAAIGPCISGVAYEVGREVVDGLVGAGLEMADFLVEIPGPRPHVDLGRAVEAQLRMSGVSEIDRIERCTFSDADLHSYRRDGAASGRLAGLIVRGDP